VTLLYPNESALFPLGGGFPLNLINRTAIPLHHGFLAVATNSFAVCWVYVKKLKNSHFFWGVLTMHTPYSWGLRAVYVK
jgi:hypothetical protein